MKTVVSISLGSTSRNFDNIIKIAGNKVRVIRQGVDGNKELAAKLIQEYDGQIAYLGLGGLNLAYQWGIKTYPCPEGLKLASLAKKSVVVDGASVKKIFDRQAVNLLEKNYQLANKKVLIVSALDRPHLVEQLKHKVESFLIGDAIFALKLPIPIYSDRVFGCLSYLTMPLLKHIPIRYLYPLGKKQDQTKPSYLSKFIDNIDIVCGDFHLFRRIMPDSLAKKIVLTSTVTIKDVLLLKKLGVSGLITSSPYMCGRALGANVWEAILLTVFNDLAGMKKNNNLENKICRLGIKPSLLKLNNS